MRWCRIRLVILGLTLCVVHVVSGNCKQNPKQLTHSTKTSDIVIEAKVLTIKEVGDDSDQNLTNFNISVQLKKDFFKGDTLFKHHWKHNKLNLRIFSEKSKKECLSTISINEKYIFFLMDNGDKSGLHFGLSAAPVKKTKTATNAVIKTLKSNQTDNDPQATKKPPVTKIPKVTKKPGKKRKPTIKLAEGPTTVPSQQHHVSLKCKAGGKPVPHVDWYKNGQPVVEIPHRRSLNSHSTKKDNRTTLILTHPSHSDSGVYTCVATNSEGTARRNVTLTVPKDWKERCPKGDGYCFNGGTCQIIPALNGGASPTENMFCMCPRQFRGERCEEREADKTLFETRQATLYHQRTLIILGIIIAVLVFIVICIASYILANQKRKRYEKSQKRNEAAKSAKPALTEKENDRRVNTGPPLAPLPTTVTEATDGRFLTANSLSEFPQLRTKPNGIARRRLEANSDYDNLTDIPTPPKTAEMFSNSSSQPSTVDYIASGQTPKASLPQERTSSAVMSSSPVVSQASVTNITISPKTEQASTSIDLENNSTHPRTFEAKSVQDLTRPIHSNIRDTSTTDPLNNNHLLKQAKVPHSQTFPIPSVLKSPPGSDSEEDIEEIPYQRHQDTGEDNLYIFEDTDGVYKSFDSIYRFSPGDRPIKKTENSVKGEMRKYQSEEGPSPILQNCSLPSHKSNRSYSLDGPSNGKMSRETEYLSPDEMVGRSLLTNDNAYDPSEDDKPWDIKYDTATNINREDRYKLTDGLLPNQEAIQI